MVKVVIVGNQRQTIALISKKPRNVVLMFSLQSARSSRSLALPTLRRLGGRRSIVVIIRSVVPIGCYSSRLSKLEARSAKYV